MSHQIKEKIKKILVNLNNLNKSNFKELDFFYIETLSYNLFMVFYLSDEEITKYKSDIIRDIKKAEDLINSA